MMNSLTETAAAIGDRVSEAQETIEDIARSLGKKLNARRTEAADGLRSGASSVRTTGRHGSEAIDRLAKGATNKLESVAEYVEDGNLRSLFIGLRKFGRRHLTGSLVVAAVVGFLAGSALRRTTHLRARTNCNQ
jgi:hypothetical protein